MVLQTYRESDQRCVNKDSGVYLRPSGTCLGVGNPLVCCQQTSNDEAVRSKKVDGSCLAIILDFLLVQHSYIHQT